MRALAAKHDELINRIERIEAQRNDLLREVRELTDWQQKSVAKITALADAADFLLNAGRKKIGARILLSSAIEGARNFCSSWVPF